MTEEHRHHRDNENQYREHERNDEFMPSWMRWSADFIQRIGFPIFMCLVLMYFFFIKMEQNTKAITDLRETMMSVKVAIENH